MKTIDRWMHVAAGLVATIGLGTGLLGPNAGPNVSSMVSAQGPGPERGPGSERGTGSESDPSDGPSSTTGIAVVELFTSQGCSSCPPADAVLRTIAETAEKSGDPVHVLSFHVDYWNRLGWKDPYSHAGYSHRQREYASLARSSRVYTPQMIVNGTSEFVGSDRTKASAALAQSLAQPSGSQIAIEHSGSGKDLVIRYDVSGAETSHVLNLALVETPSASKVTRGENNGRMLTHVNVVRRFESVGLNKASGTVRLGAPTDFVGNDAAVIGYVQDRQSGRITGAVSHSL